MIKLNQLMGKYSHISFILIQFNNFKDFFVLLYIQL